MVLRELLVKLGLNVDAQSFAQGQLAVEAIKLSLNKLVEFAESAIENVQKVAESAKELEEAAQATGVSTRALQELRDAAAQAGVNSETLSTGIFHLSRRMRETHEFKNADQAIMTLADRFAKMPDGINKTGLAMEYFGRGGAAMIPLLNKGSAGIAEMRAQTTAMTEEQIEAGKELILTQQAITRTTTQLWRDAVSPLLPAINNLLKRYLAWKKENAAIMKQNIQKYIGLVIDAVNTLGDVFSFLVRNADNVKIVLVGLAAGFIALNLASALTATGMVIAWVAAAAPFIALAAAIAGVMLFLDDIRVYKKGLEDPNFKGRSLFGLWAKTIADWQKPNSNDPWWLKAIKQLVEYMEKALGIAKQLGVTGDKQSLSEAQKTGPVGAALGALGKSMYGQNSIPARLSRGEIKARANFFGGTSYDEVTNPAEKMRLSAQYIQQNPEAMERMRGEGIVINAPINMTVVQQPGESGEDFAQRTHQLMTEYHDAKMEEAMSGVSY